MTETKKILDAGSEQSQAATHEIDQAKTAELFVTLRFYGPLNQCLRPENRQKTLQKPLCQGATVKYAIESAGVPHTEAVIVLVDGLAVSLDHRLQGGERIAVYPKFVSLDVSELQSVQPELPKVPRFVLDVHLGKLAGYLRMLGFDTLYSNNATDEVLAGIAEKEERILLTFDRGLLKRRQVTIGGLVFSRTAKEQLQEVVERFELWDRIRPLTRCIVCNGLLGEVEKVQILDRLPPRVAEDFEAFSQCRGCGRVYWEGSHFDRMQDFVQAMLKKHTEYEGVNSPQNRNQEKIES